MLALSMFHRITITLRKSIKYKMFIIYILVISIPVLFFGIISYNMSSKRIQNDYIQYKENINRQIVQNIEENIKNLSRQSMAIYTNIDDITYIMKNDSVIQDVEYLNAGKRVSIYLQSILQGNDKIFGISLITINGEAKFCFTKQDAPLNMYKAKDDKWFKDTLAIKENFLLRELHFNEFLQKSSHSENPVISIARPIINLDTNMAEGILLIDQNINQFSSIFSGMNLETGEVLAVLGKTNNIIYSNMPSEYFNMEKVIPFLESKSFGSVLLDKSNEKMLFSFFKSQEFGWKIVSLLPLSELQKRSLFIKNINITLLIILFIFILFISIFFSYFITIPIKKLILSFKKLQNGDFTTFVSVKGVDELSQIGLTFNTMVLNMKKLIEQKYELGILRKQAELESLQSQINPHFLFNTLNSIKAVADEGDTTRVSLMVKNLSDAFRYSLNRGKQIVAFSEELDHIKKYLFIQECRFAKKYEVLFDIDAEVLDFEIPRLILQPIVENAIYHGLERKFGKGELRIAAKAVDNRFYIFVSNNGMYISEDELDAINNQLDSNPETQANTNPQKLGIFNVNARIKFHYGNDFGLKFSSVKDSYTTVKISLPVTLNQ